MRLPLRLCAREAQQLVVDDLAVVERRQGEAFKQEFYALEVSLRNGKLLTSECPLLDWDFIEGSRHMLFVVLRTVIHYSGAARSVCARPSPLIKRSRFGPVATARHAAPAARVILRGVIEIQHALRRFAFLHIR